MMKGIFFTGAALAVFAAAPAAAQPDEARLRSAQPPTRSAVAFRVEARFARADSNGDGFVTRDEVRARAEARRSDRRDRSGERRGQRFERLDSNHDGSIDRSEFDAPRAERGGGRGERRGRRFARRGGGGMMMARFGARAFAMLDANRDGRVALAEARQAAFKRFDRVDSNRDGTISPDERQAARAAMRERRQEDRDD